MYKQLISMEKLLREREQRIAELEATRVPDDLLEVVIHKLEVSEQYTAGEVDDLHTILDKRKGWGGEVDHRIAALEATRVPDDLLEWLITKATYAGGWSIYYDQAEAILAKRKEASDG